MKKFLYNICLVSICSIVLIFQPACQKQEDVCQKIARYKLKCVFIDDICYNGYTHATSESNIRFREGTMVFNTCTQQYDKTFVGTISGYGLFTDDTKDWAIARNGSYEFSPDSSFILLANRLDTVFYHPGPDTAYNQTINGPWIEQKDSFQYSHLTLSGVFIYEKQ